MTRHRLLRGLVPVVLFALGFLGAAIPVSGQSYGLGDQVLTLGGADFRPNLNSEVYYFAGDGYLYVLGSSSIFIAPIHLPDGAEVFGICVYGNVPDHSSTTSAIIYGAKLAPGGQSGGTYFVPGSQLLDNIAIGYGTVCTDPGFSWVFHDEADLDGDDIPDHAAWIVYASASNKAGFGGVRILWRRQVSPPPQTASFKDVPKTSNLFPFVEALKAAGITSGYADGRFGVNDPITRGQMAAFLSVALGLHWPN
jgi:S-layer homology domain